MNKILAIFIIMLIGISTFTAGQEQKPGQGGQQPPQQGGQQQGGQQGAQMTNATAPAGGGAGGNATGGGMGDPNKSLLECVKGIDKLSLLSMALQRTELKEVADKLEKKDGEYTLFAPLNDAIQEMLQTANTSAANQTFTEQDKESLLVAGVHYHIVPKKLTTKTMKQLELPKTLLKDSKWVNLPNNQSQRLHIMDETGSKKFQIWFGLDKDGREKRANFVVQDIQCSNGIIHIIDKVVEIPLLSSKILTAGGLNKFVEGVKKAGLDDKLDKTPGVTIFAPTDNAFDMPQGQNEDELKKLLTNMIQEGVFLIKADSKGPIKFKKAGEESPEDKEGGKNETGAAGGEKGAANATAGGEQKGGSQATGIRKLLQAIANATGGGAAGEKGGANATAPGGGANATAPGGEKNATAGGMKADNATAATGKQQWKLTGSFNNWKVDGISIIVHDVFTQNGVIHVVDKFLGLPKPTGAAMNVSFSCEDMKCPSGDECCDVSIDSIKEITPRCYNPATHVCASRGSFLCGKDAPLVCGSSCFSQDKYVCHKGLFLCPVSAPKLCSISCYDPKQFKCLEGNLKLLGSEEQDKDKKEEGGAAGGAKPGDKKEEGKKDEKKK